MICGLLDVLMRAGSVRLHNVRIVLEQVGTATSILLGVRFVMRDVTLGARSSKPFRKIVRFLSDGNWDRATRMLDGKM